MLSDARFHDRMAACCVMPCAVGVIILWHLLSGRLTHKQLLLPTPMIIPSTAQMFDLELLCPTMLKNKFLEINMFLLALAIIFLSVAAYCIYRVWIFFAGVYGNRREELELLELRHARDLSTLEAERTKKNVQLIKDVTQRFGGISLEYINEINEASDLECKANDEQFATKRELLVKAYECERRELNR